MSSAQPGRRPGVWRRGKGDGLVPMVPAQWRVLGDPGNRWGTAEPRHWSVAKILGFFLEYY